MHISFLTAASAQFWFVRSLGLSMLLVLVVGSPAESAVTLAWDPNPETDIAGYIISYGTGSRQYTVSVDVGNTTTWVFSQPDSAKIYFLAVQAYNTAGLQSPYSNEVSTTPVIQPITATSLTSNAPPQPSVGNVITLAAAATGGAAPYAYKWWVFDGSTSTVGQNWSTGNTFAWTPTHPSSNYLVTVWVRSASSTVDNFDNPAARLWMTVAVSGAGSVDSNVTVTSNTNAQNPKPAETTKEVPAAASTSTGSSKPAPSASRPTPRTGIAAETADAKQNKPTPTRADTAPAVRPAQVPTVIANVVLPMGSEVPSPESRRRVVTRSHDAGSTEVSDRTNGDSYELVPTYEPPPPMAPALTVNGSRPSTAGVVAANSKSINAGLRMRSGREMRGHDPAPQDPDPLAGPAPTVTSVVPNSGSAKGGTTVTITGTNFVPGATVSFGGVPAATTVLVASSTLIVATTPSHSGGAVKVVVTNPDQQSGVRADGFKYIAPAGSFALRPAD